MQVGMLPVMEGARCVQLAFTDLEATFSHWSENYRTEGVVLQVDHRGP